MKLVRVTSMVAMFAALVFAAFGASAGEVMIIKAEKARLYFGGLYPNYLLFLQGIPDDLVANWVDQGYFAVLDVHGGPEKGKSTIVKLKATSKASPQPEWCVTEGGENFSGHGPACLNTDVPKSMNQIRFKVKVQYASAAENLPAEFQDRVWAEYPELPGRLESEVFGPVELHIFK